MLLKKEIEKFSNIACKLTSRKENLEKLLSSQRQSLYKYGLGYNYFIPKKSSKIVFVKQGNFVDNACSYCGVNSILLIHVSWDSLGKLGQRRFEFQKEQSMPT